MGAGKPAPLITPAPRKAQRCNCTLRPTLSFRRPLMLFADRPEVEEDLSSQDAEAKVRYAQLLTRQPSTPPAPAFLSSLAEAGEAEEADELGAWPRNKAWTRATKSLSATRLTLSLSRSADHETWLANHPKVEGCCRALPAWRGWTQSCLAEAELGRLLMQARIFSNSVGESPT